MKDRVPALWKDGKVVFNINNCRPSEVPFKIAHEAALHDGIRRAFGDKVANQLFDLVWESCGKHPLMQQILDRYSLRHQELDAEGKPRIDDDGNAVYAEIPLENRRQAAEEFLAHLQETNGVATGEIYADHKAEIDDFARELGMDIHDQSPRNIDRMTREWMAETGFRPERPGWLKQIISRVRLWLNRHGFFVNHLTDDDILTILARSAKAEVARRGGRSAQGNGVRFAIDEHGDYFPGPDDWGTAYTSMTGKGLDAVNFLLKKQDGWVPGAWHRDDIGDIDAVYGQTNGTDDVEDEGGYGIAHIDKKHNVDWTEVDDIIQNGYIDSSNNEKIVLKKHGAKAIVKLQYEQHRRNWLVSAFGTNYPSVGISPVASNNKGATTHLAPRGTFNIGDVWDQVKLPDENSGEKSSGAGEDIRKTDVSKSDVSDQSDKSDTDKHGPAPTDTDGAEENVRYSVSPVYTGSAADYEAPSLHYVGTGEGAQAYGWGLYGSSEKQVGEYYAQQDAVMKQSADILYDGTNSDVFFRHMRWRLRKEGIKDPYQSLEYRALSAIHNILIEKNGNVEDVLRVLKNNPEEYPADYIKILEAYRDRIRYRSALDGEEGNRHLYEQTFWPDKQENLLDYDTLISREQLDQIHAQLKKEGLFDAFQPSIDYGEELYKNLVNALGSPKAASEFLYRAGIDGITYIGDTSNVRNYVAFSDKDIRIDRHIRYSIHDDGAGFVEPVPFVSAIDDSRGKNIVAMLRPIVGRTQVGFNKEALARNLKERYGVDVSPAEALLWAREASRLNFIEENRRQRKVRDAWLYENNLLWKLAVDYAGSENFKVRVSDRMADRELSGTFWIKPGDEKKYSGTVIDLEALANEIARQQSRDFG